MWWGRGDESLFVIVSSSEERGGGLWGILCGWPESGAALAIIIGFGWAVMASQILRSSMWLNGRSRVAFLAAKVAHLVIREDGPKHSNANVAVFSFVVFGAIACAWILSLRWLDGLRPVPGGTKDSVISNSVRPASLRELFENDWPNLPGYYSVSTLEGYTLEANKITLAWRLNGDFVARSKFFAFFLGVCPSIPKV